MRPANGLSPYADGALDSACRRILGAVRDQEAASHGEAVASGTLAGAGAIPADFARRALLWAASQVRDLDPQRPWRAGELSR